MSNKDTKDAMKIAGWMFYFLACLTPIYISWAMDHGPEWLDQEAAVTSGIFLALLFWWTGGRLMGRDGNDAY